MSNIILMGDSYKVGHHKLFPPKMTNSYAAGWARVNEKVRWFGLQGILKRHLLGGVSAMDVVEAGDLFKEHFGSSAHFNEDGWFHIVKEHHGRLPLRIRALPEGTVVDQTDGKRIPLFTCESTCPRCAWLPSYVEPILEQVWYPTTVATLSGNVRGVFAYYLEKTGTPADIHFKLHDFGVRGSTSMESAGIGGTAHLLSFSGTDNLPALMDARRHYGEKMAGFSIAATEHFVMTAWGTGQEAQENAMRNLLLQFPSGPIACVIDSEDDIREVDLTIGVNLNDEIMTREGVFAARGDSGSPPHKLLLYLERLGKRFGVRANAKGYNVLDNHVRVVWGDGMNPDSIKETLKVLTFHKWSTDNIATLGMGSGLLQSVHRDDLGFAYKGSSVIIDGQERHIFKTTPGKASLGGRFSVVKVGDQFRRVLAEDLHPEMGDEDLSGKKDELRTVFLNGNLVNEENLSIIRKRSDEYGY